MKATRIAAIAIVTVLLFAAVLVPIWKSRHPIVVDSTQEPSQARLSDRSVRHGGVESTMSGVKHKGSAAPMDRDAAIYAIEEAVKTYDHVAVKTIAPYLQHSDPEIRASAREGLIQLGEQDAIGVLRLAAGRAVSPDEAKALQEAADYLELPSWLETTDAEEVITRLKENRENP